MADDVTPPAPAPDPEEVKIYLLPNLMTAGNLTCGFLAILQIIQGITERMQTEQFDMALVTSWEHRYVVCLWFILGACVFDMLDGRVARFGGNESPFGREFDSIADIVSFGVAPALLVYKFVLSEIPGPWGLVIALLYLLCGALRLARFNCVAAAGGGGTKDFTGFPIPAAAGVICSITLFLLWFYENDREIGSWKFILPPLMVFLAFMMFSKVRYPSFKALNWRTQRSIPKFIAIILTLTLAGAYLRWSLAIVFLGYLLYGFFRPFISARMRKEIEEEEEEGVA